MSTSANSAMAQLSPKNQVIAHASLKVAQMGSMITPPIYLVSSLILRRGAGFSISRLLRSTVIGTTAGAGLGALMGAGRLMNEPQAAIDDRVFRLAHSPSQIRTDDYSIMGATLAALLVPAVFKRQARLPTLAVGGGAVGLGAGVWVHIAKMFSEGNSTKPEGMVGEVPIVGGNK